MFAGLMLLNPTLEPSREEREAILRCLSRVNGPAPIEVADGPSFVARISSGALSSHDGVLRGQGRDWCIIAGEPLGPARTPEGDQLQIHGALRDKNTACLRLSRGVFCGASFHTTGEASTLRLFGDKLGIRPLYYWHDSEKVFFASALRILEQLPFVSKRRNDVGVAECVAFGYALADRTQYEDIRVLREAEVIEFSDRGMRRSQYMLWNELPTHACSRAAAVVEAQTRFHEAIEIRRRNDESVGAFLSGGMDSRAIISSLHGVGARVRAVNFSPSGSQDLEFARAFALATGIPLIANSSPCHLIPSGGFRIALTKHYAALVNDGAIQAERPRAPWSGDGGSVGLGNVHLHDYIVQMLRRGDRDDAIKHFFKENGIGFPYRLLRPSEREMVKDLLVAGMQSELERLQCDDPGQALFLFLLTNDQRRHLYDVYEDLDVHGIEYQLPFYDSAFLEFICGLPVDYRNHHRFYADWFSAFSDVTRSVPWQTYPKHVPCPLPISRELTYQWRPPAAPSHTRLKKRVNYGARALRLALLKNNLGPVSRTRLAAIGAIMCLGLRDYTPGVKAADWFGNLAGGLIR